jgi:hypothetical protein
LNDSFKITPISQAEEGSRITVLAAYAADDTACLKDQRGPAIHEFAPQGWKTESVKLPRTLKSDEEHLPSIAPAQVELK